MTPAELLAMLWEPVVPNALVDTKLSRAEAIALVEQWWHKITVESFERGLGVLPDLEQRIAEAARDYYTLEYAQEASTIEDLAAHIARHLRGETDD